MTSEQRGVLTACVVGAAFGYPTLAVVMFGQLVTPLSKHFATSSDEVGFALSIMSAVSVFSPPLAGVLIDRFGTRAVAVISGLAMAGVFMGLSAARSIEWIFAFYGLVAIMGAGTLPVAYARPIVAAFDKNLGLALGIMLSVIGLASAVLPPVLVNLAASRGVPAAYQLLALLSAIAVVPAFFLLNREPETVPARVGERDRLLRHLAKPTAIKMLAVSLLLGIFTASVWGQAVPLLLEKGMSPTDAALATSTLAIAMTITRLAAGYGMDRMFAPYLGAALLVPVVLAWFAIGLTDTTWIAILAMAAFGIGLGVEIDVFSYLTSKYLPRSLYATFYGLLFSMLALGGGLAHLIFVAANRMSGFPQAGTLTVAAIVTLAIGVLLTLPRYADSSPSEGPGADDQQVSDLQQRTTEHV